MDKVVEHLLETIKKHGEDNYNATVGYIAYHNGIATIWDTLNDEQRKKFCDAHNKVLEILGE